MDMVSDCFFVAQISLNEEYHILLIPSIIFVVIPAMTALFQLYFYARKHWLENDHIRSWLSKYSTLLLLLSVLTGSSFAATALLNSYAFHLEILDMGLTHKQLNGFNTKRIYSLVMLENLPQLCLQSYFILSSGGLNGISGSSIVFSMISIIVSILSMTLERTINFTQSYAVITMNVKGDFMKKDSKKCCFV